MIVLKYTRLVSSVSGVYRVRSIINKIKIGKTCLVSEQCELGEQGEKHGK